MVVAGAFERRCSIFCEPRPAPDRGRLLITTLPVAGHFAYHTRKKKSFLESDSLCIASEASQALVQWRRRRSCEIMLRRDHDAAALDALVKSRPPLAQQVEWQNHPGRVGARDGVCASDNLHNASAAAPRLLPARTVHGGSRIPESQILTSLHSRYFSFPSGPQAA